MQKGRTRQASIRLTRTTQPGRVDTLELGGKLRIIEILQIPAVMIHIGRRRIGDIDSAFLFTGGRVGNTIFDHQSAVGRRQREIEIIVRIAKSRPINDRMSGSITV
jgi:hypothetical protein